MRELKNTVADFTSGCFQLTFTPGRSRLLPQGFDHAFHRRERFSSPSLHAAHRDSSFLPLSSLLPSSQPPSSPLPSSRPLSSPLFFSLPHLSRHFIPSRPLDGSLFEAPSMLEELAKGKEVPRYTLSRKLQTIPEAWRE